MAWPSSVNRSPACTCRVISVIGMGFWSLACGNVSDSVRVMAGAAIMKITSSTSITSTSGVMFISAIGVSRAASRLMGGSGGWARFLYTPA
jgi:hypothetical protein